MLDGRWLQVLCLILHWEVDCISPSWIGAEWCHASARSNFDKTDCFCFLPPGTQRPCCGAAQAALWRTQDSSLVSPAELSTMWVNHMENVSSSSWETDPVDTSWILSEVAQSYPTLCYPMDQGVPTRLLCPWNFPGKNTGVGCHFLLQGIFPTQGSNPGLLYFRQTL